MDGWMSKGIGTSIGICITHMHMHIWPCICICVFICVCMCIYACVRICVSALTFIGVCVFAYMCIRARACGRAPAYVCAHAYVYSREKRRRARHSGATYCLCIKSTVILNSCDFKYFANRHTYGYTCINIYMNNVFVFTKKKIELCFRTILRMEI